MKPDIEAILDGKSGSVSAKEYAIVLSDSEIEQIKNYIADLEAVADIVRKREKKIKEWQKVVTTVDYLDEGYEKQITEINYALKQFDIELEQALTKLDGDKDG